MADLNPEQLRLLQDLIQGFERLNTRARDLGDVLEQGINTNFDKKMQAAADRAADLAKAQAAAALSTVKGMKQKERDAAIEAAGKRAAAQVQREYDENTRATSRTIQEMGQAVSKLTRAIYAGEQGQKKYADAVDTVVTSLGGLAFFVGGPLVKALTVAVMGLGKFFKASVDMGDALFKNYQEISRFGAATGDGIQGIYGLMNSFRLSTEQLGQLTQLISENAQGLALFRGTVFQGTQGLADIRKEATRTGLELEAFRLGMNPQELNETIAGFISQQARLGAVDIRNTEAATKSLREYIYETDLLTKLTGDSRKQQEAAMQRAMAIEQFRVKIAQLERENTPESIAEARRLGMTFKFLNAQSPGLAAGFAGLTTGLVGPDGVGALLVTNNKIYEAANARGITFGETISILNQGLQENLGPGGLVETLGMFGGLNKTTGLAIQELYNLGKLTDAQAAKIAAATSEQELQTILTEQGLDNMVKTQKADLDAMQNMQDFVRLGVNPATAALAVLANVVSKITSILPGTGTQAAAATAGGLAAGYAGMKAGAAGGAAIGSVIPGAGTAAGGILGGVAGGILGFFGMSALAKGVGSLMGPGSNPEDILDFANTSSSNLERFRALDPRVQAAVLAAGQEYTQLNPGRKLKVNSAMRTREDQQRLYDDYVRRGGRGMPVAPPGTSAHESGLAVDIQQGRESSVVDILRKHGLIQNVPNDPVHFSMAGAPAYAYGGIAQGPRSGYQATLHGTEAIVPLPDGRTIPVEMPSLSDGMREQVSMMREQIGRLDELISTMRTQNAISNKMLMVAQN